MISVTLDELVAWLVFGVLALVASLHAYWAFGGLWPGRDAKSLAKMVIGEKGRTEMPSVGLTLIVAALIFAAGLLPVLRGTWVSAVLPWDLVQGGMVLMAVIFLGRGALSFSPYFVKMGAEEPFRTLDRHYYGPLCLAIGVGFVWLL